MMHGQQNVKRQYLYITKIIVIKEMPAFSYFRY